MQRRRHSQHRRPDRDPPHAAAHRASSPRAGVRLHRSGQCTDYLVFRTKVEFSTDEGTISGQFEAEGVSYLDGVYLSPSVDSKQCAGSLGIRLDRNRPSRGFVSITVQLRDGVPTGRLYTGVIYTDVELLTGEEGDGIFWPADDLENHCVWLEGSSPMISLDEYNQL